MEVKNMALMDSFNSFASKTKDLTEVARINMEISTYESKMRECYMKLGEYVMEHSELINTEDETVAFCRKEYEDVKEKIDADKLKIREIKNVDVCPNCGAEISRENQLCPKCGQQIVRVEPAQPKKNVCPKCGAEVAEGAMFCGSCGAKLDTAAEDNIVDPAEPAQDVTETQNKD